MDINGTHIWYYKICKRETWLMMRNIVPDQHDENIDLGRFMHEFYYKRDKKEIAFGNVKFDILFQSKNEIVIGENKKSSKYEEASKWQLLYYLKVLKKAGINAKGQLVYPSERKRVNLELTKEVEDELNNIIDEIEKLSKMKKPPKVKKISFCKNCGYREFCFS